MVDMVTFGRFLRVYQQLLAILTMTAMATKVRRGGTVLDVSWPRAGSPPFASTGPLEASGQTDVLGPGR